MQDTDKRPILQPASEDRPYLRKLAWTVVAAAAIFVVWRASDLLLLAFGSVLGAIMFRSAGRQFEKIGVRNAKVALGLGMLVVMAIIGLMFWMLAVEFGTQIAGMVSNLPSTLRDIEDAVGTTEVGRSIVSAVEASEGGSRIAQRLGDLLSGSGVLLLNFVIVIVGAMFIAGSPGTYVRGLVLLVPPPGRPAMERAIRQVSLALRLWLKAKLITMTAMGVLISAGLYIAGVPSWAALGLLGGISEFVPYVGPTVAMVPAIGLAAAAGSDVLLKTLGAFLVVRIIEAYMLTPAVNSTVVSIPPAMTLFVILGAGAVFGVYGIFFAGALLVVAFVMVRELYLRDTLGEDIEGVPDSAKIEADKPA